MAEDQGAVAVVRGRKKLKVMSIVGVPVALFALVAFLSVYYSTDARINRAVAQIVDEYGFELDAQLPSYSKNPHRSFVRDRYVRPPLGAESADEIAEILLRACPSCEYEHRVDDDDRLLFVASGVEPLREVHYYRTEEARGGMTARIHFVPDVSGFGIPQVEPSAHLNVFNYEKPPGLWDRLKATWLW